MKNYEDMSDFEINCRVHAEVMQISGLNSFKAKDYCNNPVDAWPIVVENNIALLPSCGFDWVAISHLTLNGFSSYIDQSLHGCLQHNDMNPLRAAMIVFLKMNEDKL